MDEEKIISKEMVLTLLLIFSIFGVIYLYCAGVDSWEKMPQNTKEKCVEYYAIHFRENLADGYMSLRYKAALDTIHHSLSWKKRNTYFLLLNTGSALANYVKELDWKNSLPYYILASSCRATESYQYLDLAAIYTEMGFIYYKQGKTKKRDSFLEKADKMLRYCKNHEDLKNDKKLSHIVFDNAAVKARILAKSGKFLQALELLKMNEKGERRIFSLFLGSDFVRAEIYRTMGNKKLFAEELERLDRLFCMNRKNGVIPYLYYNLLSYYKNNKEYRKCITFIENQIKRAENSQKKALFMLDLAGIYEKMGEKKKALLTKMKASPLSSAYKKSFYKKVKLYDL